MFPIRILFRELPPITMYPAGWPPSRLAARRSWDQSVSIVVALYEAAEAMVQPLRAYFSACLEGQTRVLRRRLGPKALDVHRARQTLQRAWHPVLTRADWSRNDLAGTALLGLTDFVDEVYDQCVGPWTVTDHNGIVQVTMGEFMRRWPSIREKLVKLQNVDWMSIPLLLLRERMQAGGLLTNRYRECLRAMQFHVLDGGGWASVFQAPLPEGSNEAEQLLIAKQDFLVTIGAYTEIDVSTDAGQRPSSINRDSSSDWKSYGVLGVEVHSQKRAVRRHGGAAVSLNQREWATLLSLFLNETQVSTYLQNHWPTGKQPLGKTIDNVRAGLNAKLLTLGVTTRRKRGRCILVEAIRRE